MSRLTISFESSWLDDRRNNGVRVVRQLEKWISRDDAAKIVSSSATSLTVEMKPAHRADFVEALGRELAETFGEEPPWRHATFMGDLEGLDVPKAGGGQHKAAAPRQDAAAAAKPAENVAAPAGMPPDPGKVVDEICASVPVKHSREMAAYVRETAAIIPMLQKMGVTSNLWHQHLLLAMDEGYGRSDFLSGLARLYAAFGLLKGDVDEKTVREIILCADPEESDGRYRLTWKETLDVARDMARANEKNGLSRAVLYLDISAWQGKLATSDVKRHLRWLNRFTGSFLVVFRVPFIEAHVLRDVSDALNDILNVRTLAVPPLPIGDMADYARSAFAEQGFTLAPEASDAFEQWILCEKGDDSFFGYKTMDKIVQRAIYEKARANCAAGSEDRTVVFGHTESIDLPEDPSRDGHVFRDLLPVIVAVAAVVGDDADRVLLTEFLTDAGHVAQGFPDRREVFRAHPAVAVPAFFIRFHEVQKDEIRPEGPHGLERAVGQIPVRIGQGLVPDVFGQEQILRESDVAERFPAVKYGAGAAGVPEQRGQAGELPAGGCEIVGQDPVLPGRDTAKEGIMNGQRDGRDDRAARQGVAAALHHFRSGGMAAGKKAVRPHAVDADQNHFSVWRGHVVYSSILSISGI